MQRTSFRFWSFRLPSFVVFIRPFHLQLHFCSLYLLLLHSPFLSLSINLHSNPFNISVQFRPHRLLSSPLFSFFRQSLIELNKLSTCLPKQWTTLWLHSFFLAVIAIHVPAKEWIRHSSSATHFQSPSNLYPETMWWWYWDVWQTWKVPGTRHVPRCLSR